MFRIDKWYAIYKYADLATVEAENMKYGQGDGNLWDMIEYRKNKFIPQIQTIASDKFGSPQLPYTKKFHSMLRYNPPKGQKKDKGKNDEDKKDPDGYYDIVYKNLNLSRQRYESVLKLSVTKIIFLFYIFCVLSFFYPSNLFFIVLLCVFDLYRGCAMVDDETKKCCDLLIEKHNFFIDKSINWSWTNEIDQFSPDFYHQNPNNKKKPNVYKKAKLLSNKLQSLHEWAFGHDSIDDVFNQNAFMEEMVGVSAYLQTCHLDKLGHVPVGQQIVQHLHNLFEIRGHEFPETMKIVEETIATNKTVIGNEGMHSFMKVVARTQHQRRMDIKNQILQSNIKRNIKLITFFYRLLFALLCWCYRCNVKSKAIRNIRNAQAATNWKDDSDTEEDDSDCQTDGSNDDDDNYNNDDNITDIKDLPSLYYMTMVKPWCTVNGWRRFCFKKHNVDTELVESEDDCKKVLTEIPAAMNLSSNDNNNNNDNNGDFSRFKIAPVSNVSEQPSRFATQIRFGKPLINRERKKKSSMSQQASVRHISNNNNNNNNGDGSEEEDIDIQLPGLGGGRSLSPSSQVVPVAASVPGPDNARSTKGKCFCNCDCIACVVVNRNKYNARKMQLFALTMFSYPFRLF